MSRKFIKSGLVNTFRIAYDDGDVVEITTIPGDAMRWETLNKKPFQANIGASSLMWTAWRALRREGRCDEKSFDAWVDNVRDFEVEDDDDPEADPDDPIQPDL